MKDRLIEKQKELIDKKGSCIHHMVKIILRNANNITLRTWESDFISNYSDTYFKLESEISALESEIKLKPVDKQEQIEGYDPIKKLSETDCYSTEADGEENGI